MDENIDENKYKKWEDEYLLQNSRLKEASLKQRRPSFKFGAKKKRVCLFPVQEQPNSNYSFRRRRRMIKLNTQRNKNNAIDVEEILKSSRIESSEDFQPLTSANYLFEDFTVDK